MMANYQIAILECGHRRRIGLSRIQREYYCSKCRRRVPVKAVLPACFGKFLNAPLCFYCEFREDCQREWEREVKPDA